ncbi:MAG: hypothetical protein ABJK28_02090 [Algibacter sp.]
MSSYTSGAAYLTTRTSAWSNWNTWQRGSSIGLKNIIKLGGSDSSGHIFRIYDKDDGTTASINLHSNGYSYLNGGNVGIGTTNPGSWKLAVNGEIRAKEIKVETDWSDFVFHNNYKLPTLKEVETHIKKKVI